MELRSHHQDGPGGPVVKTPLFHCRGHGFDPWSGTKIPHATWHGQKKKSPPHHCMPYPIINRTSHRPDSKGWELLRSRNAIIQALFFLRLPRCPGTYSTQYYSTLEGRPRANFNLLPVRPSIFLILLIFLKQVLYFPYFVGGGALDLLRYQICKDFLVICIFKRRNKSLKQCWLVESLCDHIEVYKLGAYCLKEEWLIT